MLQRIGKYEILERIGVGGQGHGSTYLETVLFTVPFETLGSQDVLVDVCLTSP